MRSIDPKIELDETTELNKILTQGREATRVEGGTEGSRRSPPAVPRTRRSTSVSYEREEPGIRRDEGDHFSLATGL